MGKTRSRTVRRGDFNAAVDRLPAGAAARNHTQPTRLGELYTMNTLNSPQPPGNHVHRAAQHATPPVPTKPYRWGTCWTKCPSLRCLPPWWPSPQCCPSGWSGSRAPPPPQAAHSAGKRLSTTCWSKKSLNEIKQNLLRVDFVSLGYSAWPASWMRGFRRQSSRVRCGWRTLSSLRGAAAAL